MHDTRTDILLGLVGTIAPALGVITSFQEQFEWWLRVTSLLGGIVVAVLSAASLLRKLGARGNGD